MGAWIRYVSDGNKDSIRKWARGHSVILWWRTWLHDTRALRTWMRLNMEGMHWCAQWNLRMVNTVGPRWERVKGVAESYENCGVSWGKNCERVDLGGSQGRIGSLNVTDSRDNWGERTCSTLGQQKRCLKDERPCMIKDLLVKTKTYLTGCLNWDYVRRGSQEQLSEKVSPQGESTEAEIIVVQGMQAVLSWPQNLKVSSAL